MKKQFLLSLLSLLLLQTTQILPAHATGKLLLIEKVDRLTGQTQLYTKKLRFGMFPSLEMQAVYSYSTQPSNASYPAYVLLKTTHWSQDINNTAVPNTALTFNLEGTAVNLGQPISYQVQHWQKSVRQENATYQISLDTFRLASATRIQAQLGGLSMRFSKMTPLQSWQELSSRINTFSNKTTTSSISF